MSDPRLAELSGLAVDAGAVWAMADGGRKVAVHRVDLATCAITQTRGAAIDPYDPEDLARGPDGSLWVADTGDNDRDRATVAVVVLPAGGAARLHRLSYPDGPHDAEALLVDGAGRPLVITKEVGTGAGIYRSADAPSGTGPTPLERVGTVRIPSSQTEGGPLAGLPAVTGAAASPDGRAVALRTYTDAWLFPVTDGDLVAALEGDPVQVPLPDEPQGEAIAFTADGTLLSGSEARGGVRGQIRAVPAAAAAVAAPPPAPGSAAAAGEPAAGPAAEWAPAAIGAGVAVGLLALVAVVLAARRRR